MSHVPTVPSSLNSSAKTTVCCRHQKQERRWLARRPLLELLEPRHLMTASPLDTTDPSLLSYGPCQCPVCTGAAMQNIPVIQAATTTTSSTSPLSAIPQLSSNTGARAKLYLDFNGNFESRWGSYTNVTTKVYDIDGNATTFSATELTNIQEIWARVAEDYAPFNIDVTTIDPGANADGVIARIAIGGNYSDWFGSSAGGVAYVGGFSNSAPNTGYVFSDALGKGNPRYVAEAAAHEAGHLFGLSHQSAWSGTTLTSAYSQGNANWAPIMGVGYYSARTTWFNGATSSGPTAYQDDVAILAGASNAFGLRADDYGGTFQTGVWRGATGGSIIYSGIINNPTDEDFALFNTGAGAVSFRLDVAQFGANLDSILEIRNSSGQVVASSNPSDSFGASITTTLAAGTYALVVRSTGGYGNMGQYTISGTAIATTSGTTVNSGGNTTVSAVEIDLSVDGVGALASGGTVNFGNAVVGTSVTRTITILNSGTGTLNLTPINASTLPAGFSIVTNLGKTSLTAGQSTTLVLRMSPSAAGNLGGTIVLSNNDFNEGAYQIRLSGMATVPQTITQTIDDGAAGNSTTGTWTVRANVGRSADVRVAKAGGTTAVATYDFTGLTNGTYRILANWTGGSEYANNTPITITDGVTFSSTVRVNQKAASSGVNVDGTNWTAVNTVVVQNGRLIVRYSTSGVNGSVQADSIRIERIVTAASSSRSLVIEDESAELDSNPNVVIEASSGESLVTANAPSGVATPRSNPLQLAANARASLFQNLRDWAPEQGVLEETLSLLGQSRRATNPSDSSLTLAGRTTLQDSLFSLETNWLSS